MSDIVLSAGVRSNLLQLQQTSDLITSTQTRLATGKRVNSALDNPINFFTAQGLTVRANDLMRAAMRWVAADPQAVAPRERAQTGLPETAATGRSVLDVQRAESPHQPDPMRLPEVQAWKTAPRHDSLSLPAALTQPATPRVEPEAAGREPEAPLEISIGAIHLRVEAPAPQTVARPLAPPARDQQPAAPAPSTRSGLSRRALRRF